MYFMSEWCPKRNKTGSHGSHCLFNNYFNSENKRVSIWKFAVFPYIEITLYISDKKFSRFIMSYLSILILPFSLQVLCISSENSASLSYRRYVDKALAIKNSTAATYSKEENERRCISKCSLDSECSAAAFDDVSKTCTLNRCGRNELVASQTSTVNVKGTAHNVKQIQVLEKMVQRFRVINFRKEFENLGFSWFE